MRDKATGLLRVQRSYPTIEALAAVCLLPLGFQTAVLDECSTFRACGCTHHTSLTNPGGLYVVCRDSIPFLFLSTQFTSSGSYPFSAVGASDPKESDNVRYLGGRRREREHKCKPVNSGSMEVPSHPSVPSISIPHGTRYERTRPSRVKKSY